jgi:hypothetical protein
MARLVRAIRDGARPRAIKKQKLVDGRDKHGHDVFGFDAPDCTDQS